jgi:methionyl-tRNA formyltransferase
VKILAQKYKIPVFQPAILNAEILKSELPPADIFIVAAYGKIIPRELIDRPKYGSLNVHPSLLPRWRGPSPIQFTILNGDAEAGVTIIKMDELMDHGPILTNSKFQILNSKLTYLQLHEKLARLGAELLIKTLPQYIEGKIPLSHQDDARATYSKILKRDDGRINWSQPADAIERQIRAFNPWPGSFSVWPDKGKYLRLRVDEAEASENEPDRGSSGYIWLDEKKLSVKAGKGSLKIIKITPAGGKTMTAEEFMRGHPDFVGSNLI